MKNPDFMDIHAVWLKPALCIIPKTPIDSYEHGQLQAYEHNPIRPIFPNVYTCSTRSTPLPPTINNPQKNQLRYHHQTLSQPSKIPSAFSKFHELDPYKITSIEYMYV